jgi:hypothetical protein
MHLCLPGHGFDDLGSLSAYAFVEMLFISFNSMQHDNFTQVMNPLVDEFLGGKSGVLVAMGPTGSGKTQTIFGTARHLTRYSCFGSFTTKVVHLVMYKRHILFSGPVLAC